MDYGESKGSYVAEVTVGDDKREIKVELPPTISAVVLKACVNELTMATEQAANSFGEHLQESVKDVKLLPS